MDRPGLFWAFVLALMTVGLLGAAIWLRERPEIGGVALLVMMVTGIFSLYLIWERWDYMRGERELVRATARATTQAVVLAREIRQMTAEQLLAAGPYMAKDQVLITDADGEMSLVLPTEGGPVDWDFIAEFLRESDAVSCRPVTRYRETSDEGRQARAFTNWLIGKGYAIPWVRGDQTGARWKAGGRQRAAGYFRIELMAEVVR